MKKILFVVLIEEIFDKSMYEIYIKKVVKIINSFCGEYIARSNKIISFSGDKPERVIIIAFKSIQEAEACFHSKEYEAIKVLREKSTKSKAFFVENDI